MTPQDYAKALRDEGLGNNFTAAQKQEAQEVLERGMDFIGKRVSSEFTEMTAEAVKYTITLKQFLMVFIEHSYNFDRIDKLYREGILQ